MFIIFQFLFAYLYSHLLEWVLHRYILHNPKRKKFFKSHFGDHHKTSRKYLMIDPKYLQKASIKGDPEIKGLIVLGIIHLPISYWFPWAYLTLLLCAVEYWWVHRKAHQDISWARDNLSHHYDHHLAPNQHANWGVRSSVFDRLLGTRKVYKGNKKEAIKYILIRNRLESIARRKNAD